MPYASVRLERFLRRARRSTAPNNPTAKGHFRALRNGPQDYAAERHHALGTTLARCAPKSGSARI